MPARSWPPNSVSVTSCWSSPTAKNDPVAERDDHPETVRLGAAGEMALGIGAHSGALYAGTLVFAVIQVTGSFSGVLGAIGQYGFPKMLLVYLAVVAWLSWSQGEVPIRDSIARWDDD